MEIPLSEVDDYLSNIGQWKGLPDVLLLTLNALNDQVKTQQETITRMEDFMRRCSCCAVQEAVDKLTDEVQGIQISNRTDKENTTPLPTPTPTLEIEDKVHEAKHEILDSVRRDIVELKQSKANFKDLQKHVRYTRGAIEDISKDMLMKSNIKDICTLLDVKANTEDVNSLFDQIDEAKADKGEFMTQVKLNEIVFGEF